jgi:outer membrane protein insertion porin family
VKPTGGEGVVDVELAVEEGALCRIRNIEIEGNERTRDKVMRRELLVAPAEIFDEVKVRRSEKRLQNLGFFSDVRSYPRETGTPGESDLIFEVAEQKTGQFMAGAGFSSVDQLVGFVEISQGNFDLRGWPTFTGGGQKLRARAQWGSDQENYSLSFVEPWFLDRKLSLSLEGYSTQHDYEGYDVSRRGGSVGIGKALPGANRVEIKYSLEKSRIVDVTDTNAYVDPAGQPFYFTNQEDAVESSVRVTFTHDSRDNYFIPTRGMRATASGRISGGILGFDTDTYGLEGRVIQHVPLWFRHVLSLEVMAQVVDAYGDTPEVPLSDRLFIGGPMTVRGYEYRDMGPKATRTAVSTNGTTSVYTRPIGGQTLAMASAEYTIPVVTRVRLAAFFDIGNVWEEPYDVDFGNLGSSAGIGIRLDMPFFPMRFDYAWPVKKDSDLTEEEPFSFSVSYGF